ncbi:MAG: endolytic transglycosylase MltG [Eubacterium sp.]
MDNFSLNETKKEETGDIYFSNNVAQEDEAQSLPPTSSNTKKPKSATSTYMFFLIVIVVSIFVSVYAIFCMNDILAITKGKSNVTVSFSEQITSNNEAIDLLADKGLIRCKNFCKLFLSVRNVALKNSKIEGPYEAGMYYLNGKMGLEGMLITLEGDTASSETVTLTFSEGYTVPEIVNKLAENDVCDKAALLSVIQSTEFNYPLVNGLKAEDSVPYRLEGYLFPDTYEFFINESAASTIKKFLDNGNNKYIEKYSKRAKELGYTDREIIIIASIIQKEAANDEQMAEISAVIHNRLKDTVNFPTLGCQSTSDYIKNKVAPSLGSTSSHTSDYYLTYYNTNNNSTVVGLPAGAICNPGLSAIKAALYPAKSNAKFFFHDNKGNMYTATSYSEFKSKVQRYAPYLES